MHFAKFRRARLQLRRIWFVLGTGIVTAACGDDFSAAGGGAGTAAVAGKSEASGGERNLGGGGGTTGVGGSGTSPSHAGAGASLNTSGAAGTVLESSGGAGAPGAGGGIAAAVGGGMGLGAGGAGAALGGNGGVAGAPGSAGFGEPETGGAGQETGGTGQETGGTGQETGGTGQETGGAGQETGGAGQETGGAGQETGGTSGAAGSIEACPSTHVCAPEVPSTGTWEGPVVIVEDTTASACVDEYASLAVNGGTDLLSQGSCDCGCGSASATCTDTVVGSVFSLAECYTGLDQVVLTPSENPCTRLYYSSEHSWSIRLDPPAVQCGSGSFAASGFAAALTGEASICRGVALEASCEGSGESCLPLPPASALPELCIYSPGEVVCPTTYPDQTIIYEDFVDDRTCSGACSCTGEGGECSVSVLGYLSTDCSYLEPPSVQAVVTSSEPVCVFDQATQGSTVAFDFDAGELTVTNNGQCTSTDTTAPTGSVSLDPNAAYTVCCWTPGS